MTYLRKTKIICTIGPASGSTGLIEDLVKSGMDVARINFSHGSHIEHEAVITNIRNTGKLLKREIPIIADLCGPKVRVGKLEKEVILKKDDTVQLSSDRSISSGNIVLQITYEKLYQDVETGDRVLINDGLIELVVTGKRDGSVYCKVINGGVVQSNKGVNLPDSELSTPSLTEKDKADIDFALQHNLDFLALSFVRSSDDILYLREYLKTRGSSIPIIAKIEKPQAIDDLDEIIRHSDLIMIARGDLGVEMNAYEVPILQKEIIRKCLILSKPVITATQMLESMINNPRSTRAEASDVANAVFDGTDTVMLSGETSIGSYPVQAVRVMHSILLRAEQTDYFIAPLQEEETLIDDPKLAINLSSAACRIAQAIKAAAIIAVTKTGRTARFLAKQRTKTPILAFSPNPKTVTELKLCWGVESVLLETCDCNKDILIEAKEIAIRKGFIAENDLIVFVSGSPILETDEINMIRVEKVMSNNP